MRIRLLGGFEAEAAAGRPLRFATRKSLLLFAALVLAGQRGHRREALAEGFWPGRGEAQARNSFRQALADIRRNLHETGETGFSLASGLETVELIAAPETADVWIFERAISSDNLAELAAAAVLYRGDLLAGMTIPDGLEEWFNPPQHAFRQRALDLVERISILSPAPGSPEHAACEGLALRLLGTDPAAEPAHRALMRIKAASGEQNAALRQFEVCRASLKKHLGAEPETKTVLLAESLNLTSNNGARFNAPAPVAETRLLSNSPLSPRRNDQPSLAVMAFDNLGPATDEYFADGVVEEITSALSRVRDFFVIARQSAFAYKGRFVDAQAVGKELGVDYLVEGTVRRGGDRLRISVQLVETQTRNQLWSDRYEGSAGDIFEFQDRIAAQVAGAIHPAIRGAEIQLARRRPPNSLSAYDLVMRAYPDLWGRRKETNDAAIDLLKKAVASDPTYGRAHALLAWCLASRAAYLWSGNPERDLDLARAAIDAAGSIGDDPTALTAAGSAMSIIGEQNRAAALIEKALALDPNNSWAWARYGWIGIYVGDDAKARERFARAMALSPLDPLAFNMRLGVATSLAKSGALGEAITIAREVIAAHPEIIMSYRYLAAWSAMSGDIETSRWAARRLIESQPGFTIDRYRSLPFFFHMPQWADKVADALRQAGLPER